MYENPTSLKQRLQGVKPTQPTQSELRNMARDTLVDGIDPDYGVKSVDCPRSGCSRKVQECEEIGPNVPGLRETIEWVRETHCGDFTEAEFRDLVAEAVVQVLDEEIDPAASAECHATLDEFAGRGLDTEGDE